MDKLGTVMNHYPYTTSELMETPERRVVDLTSIGFPEIPVLGMNRSVVTSAGSEFHRHAGCMEITFCARGNAKFDCDGKVYHLLPGKVFSSLPENAHRLRTNQKGVFLYWLFFRLPKRGESVLGLPRNESDHLVKRLKTVATKIVPVPNALQLEFAEMLRLYEDKSMPEAARKFRIRVALVNILSAIIDGRPKLPESHGDDALFARIIAEMRREPEHDFNIDRLVSRTKLSPNTILSRFKRLTGLPPHAFLIKCRIHSAMKLLEKTDDSVVKISEKLKFSSPQHLAERFHQETGMSPRAWREQSRTDKKN